MKRDYIEEIENTKIKDIAKKLYIYFDKTQLNDTLNILLQEYVQNTDSIPNLILAVHAAWRQKENL